MKQEAEKLGRPEAGQSVPWALENLPPFSPVAMRLVALLSDENVHVEQVSRFIAAEPVFAARVLQLANSPLFALARQVTSIPQAVIIIGLERVKAIALTRAMGDFVAPVLRRKALAACWRNTLAGAVLAESLAPLCHADPGTAYTGGLLRDIGRLALMVKYPEAYSNAIEIARDSGMGLLETERNLFDLDHCEAGRWLVGRMFLPEEICRCVVHHHDAALPDEWELVRLVRTADRLADALGYGIVPGAPQPDPASVLEEVPGASQRARLDPEQLGREVERRIAALA
ncbi:MAG: HDOD domain-containing protein [Bryobacteraceae bacterium]|nr:HDOD domain-containing protein [Bryobacteraceae bacterium]